MLVRFHGAAQRGFTRSAYFADVTLNGKQGPENTSVFVIRVSIEYPTDNI